MDILGIDPGLHGGLAFISKTNGITVRDMPLTGAGDIDLIILAGFLECHARGSVAYVEKTSAWPGQGVSSMFKFGLVCGIVHGMLAAYQIPFNLVAPQTWKKVILHDTAKDKNAAIQWCKNYFPSVSLRASGRATKDHDGLADALCIAEWGRRDYYGKL